MNKKIMTIISVLLALSLITLSCSKNNLSSPVIKNEGLKSYAGTWKASFDDDNYDLIIGSDGSVKIGNDYAYDIKDLGGIIFHCSLQAVQIRIQ